MGKNNKLQSELFCVAGIWTGDLRFRSADTDSSWPLISLYKSYGDLLLQIFQHSFYTLTNLLLSFSFLQCYKHMLIFFPVTSLSPEFLQLSKQSKKEHRFSWNLIFDSVKAENFFKIKIRARHFLRSCWRQIETQADQSQEFKKSILLPKKFSNRLGDLAFSRMLILVVVKLLDCQPLNWQVLSLIPPVARAFFSST